MANYSRFPVIHNLYRMTARHVISNMQVIISAYGWSDTLVYYNYPCYNAAEFKQALEEMGVHNITSSPHHHQSK